MEILLKNCPKLYKIKLENNAIDDLENLKCLEKYKIEKINLKGNPVANEEDYQEELFEMVPSLKSIDGKDRKGNPVESTYYGDDEEEEEEDDVNYEEAEDEDLSEEDEEGEDNYDDDDDEEDEDKPHKKPKE